MHTGAAEVKQEGAETTLLGTGFSYTSRVLFGSTIGTFDSSSGANWLSSGIPYLSKFDSISSSSSSSSASSGGANEVMAVFDLCTTYTFAESGGGYVPLFGAHQTLTFDPALCRFICNDCSANSWKFKNNGSFDSVKMRNSDAQEIKGEYTSDGKLKSVFRTRTVGASTVTDSNVYEYYETGEFTGYLRSVTFQRSLNPVVGIRRTVYTYYGASDSHGSFGDLKTATVQLPLGTRWVDKDTSYYRYYKAGDAGGFEHGLKFALRPDAFTRLSNDPQVSDPFLAPDSKVAQYADNYYEYNGDRRATKSVVRAGLLTYLFDYEVSSHADGFNSWHLKVSMTHPDGSQTITYSNYIAQEMLTDRVSGDEHWIQYHEFDENAREIRSATPAAVISYDDSQADLGVELKVSGGLISLTEYYDTTTAGPTTPGGADGYIRFSKFQDGTGGTPINQTETTYYERTAGSAITYPVAESTVFRDDAGSEPITTTASYLWYADTAQPQQITTTLPNVPAGQNGFDTTDTIVEDMDEEGRRVRQQDPRGIVTVWSVDAVTGAVLQQIQDEEGLHLVTDFEHDILGRTTQSLGPSHEVNGISVRTATWTVYRDLENEVYSSQGYATGVGPEYSYTLVNPVSISRTSEDGLTGDSITAVRDCESSEPCGCEALEAGVVESDGRLSSSDCFPQQNWVRWSRSINNKEDQTIASRVYHRIPKEGPGEIGLNYDETLFGYDRMDRQNRVVAASGTISRTVFDGIGRPVQSWMGTDDRYATEADPTGGGVAGNNMVVVSEGQYDNGNDGGNSNLTRQVAQVNASVGRVTDFTYDFRNRRTTTDGEVDYFEEIIYDNLNQVVREDRRDANAGGNLIARNESQFDNRGRVYRTIRYAVNPSTGVVGNSLVDNTWYDQSGNVIISLPSGANLYSKSFYDGVGRTTQTAAGFNSEDTYEPTIGPSDILFEETFQEYDPAGNVLLVTRKQRYHNADQAIREPLSVYEFNGTGASATGAGPTFSVTGYAPALLDLGVPGDKTASVSASPGLAYSSVSAGFWLNCTTAFLASTGRWELMMINGSQRLTFWGSSLGTGDRVRLALFGTTDMLREVSIAPGWHHFAFSRGSDTRMYLDGILQGAPVSWSPVPNTGHVFYLDAAGAESAAAVDQLVVADVTYSEDEWRYVVNGGSGLPYVEWSTDESGILPGGELQGPAGPQPKSRDSYQCVWYDGLGRSVASAVYGTNDNVGPPDRPPSPPESSDLVLVSQTRYNERGEAFESVDPTGKVTHTESDDVGRHVRVIQNFKPYETE